MWGPAMGLPSRLALSMFAGPGRSCILGSGAATRKDWQAKHCRGFSDFYMQPLFDPDLEESPFFAPKIRSEPMRYVACRKMAKNLVRNLLGYHNPSRQLFLECNPGPGILTEALLKAGARVVVFESEKSFIPHLKSLRMNLDGLLQVVHSDFFKIDPRHQEVLKPEYNSRVIFQNLGINPVPWSAGIPIKVFGILPSKLERRILWKTLFDLYSCESIYRYGRVELNLFVTEKEFQRLMATPRRPDLYQVLSVLWQVACEIKFIQMEPWSSFSVHTENGCSEDSKLGESSRSMKQNLYFIQMTPRRSLFTEHLSPLNYDIFFHMVKHCFGKRSSPIIQHLRSLSTVEPIDILRQVRIKPGETILKMYPQDFKRLFETIERSEDCVFKWVYDESLEDIVL
ncbi:dimethyladenosine transferase 2, mitochondrial [Phodopus roborovskii]|uniref:rRNA adenine N(6)-methyltransferase n=1 Tax=Phodopus roborovskii TaxID=109678 RepID=A0AAU9ZCJ6_PHORO|nr:dimethyladenosine transferase 2, mitochondrial [Phodopus roborovskii]CAH6789575.1 Tfb2m [Phodopus roborovskii]